MKIENLRRRTASALREVEIGAKIVAFEEEVEKVDPEAEEVLQNNSALREKKWIVWGN